MSQCNFQIQRHLFKISTSVEAYRPEDNAGEEPEFGYRGVVQLNKNNHA